MKKRLLALFLAFVMAMSLLPVSVFADGGTGGQLQGTKDNPITANSNGVTVNKYVSGDAENGYSLTLEAYASDQLTTTTTTTPLDIVLVLDVSGSMDEVLTDAHTEYQRVYEIDQSKYYFIKDGHRYRKVEYTEAYTTEEWVWYGFLKGHWEIFEHHAGWIYGSESDPEYVVPMTSAEDPDTGHTQFYTAVSTQRVTKMEALQNAVNSFIDQVSAKNNGVAEESQHRISLVKFADDSYYQGNYDSIGDNHLNHSDYNYTQVVKDFTSAAGDLKTAVNNLDAGGATAADYGLELANHVFNGDENLTGARINAKKVLVFFTDGEPNHSNGFSGRVAAAAVNTAKKLKSNGVRVYTVGVFEEETTNISQYMNGVSSNYPNASAEGGWNYFEYGNKNTDGVEYYALAKDAEDLNSIFEGIADSVTTGTLEANPDSMAVLSDSLSQYVKFPQGLTGSSDQITVKFAKANAYDPDTETFTFETPTENLPGGANPTVTVNEETGTINITGFDYKANAASYNKTNSKVSGGKLVVTFPIEINKDACNEDTTITNGYYPTNSKAELSYKGSKDSVKNDASTELTESPKVSHTKPEFTVTWKNWDGATLKTDENVTYGTKPSYGGSVPTKPDDDNTYTFVGWATQAGQETGVADTALPKVTDNVIYYAAFSKTEITRYSITINYQDDKGNELKTPHSESQKVGFEYSFDVSSDATGDIPFIIVKDEKQYVFNQIKSGSLSGTVAGAVNITAEYLLDSDKDGTPDKYEATVTYKVVNGTWSDSSTTDKTEKFNLKKFNHTTNAWESANPTLGSTIPTGMKPDGTHVAPGAWDEMPAANTPVIGPKAYTYTFNTSVNSNLKVEKTLKVNGSNYATGSKVKAGDVLTYTIKVTNTGNVSLSGIAVTDTFTGSAAPTTTTEGVTWTLDPASNSYKATWNIEGTLAADANATLTYTYTVQAADQGKTITNSAVAASSDTTGSDTNEVTVYNPDMTVTKAVTKVNDTVVTADKPVMVQKDDVLTYTITVQNTGDQDLTNVVVTDTKWSNGTEITVSGVNNPVTLTSNSYTISSLAEDAIVTITYTYKVTDADVTAGEVTNKVFVKSYETPDGESGGTTTKVVGNYTIIASSGANGSIDPVGSVKVAAGTDKTFTITADTGYHISDVKVDGVSVGTVSSYTFKNVKANHTIHATFAKNSNPTSYTLYYHPNFGGYKPFYQSSSTRNVTVKEYDDVGRLPERDGYVFVSWNTEPDGSGERYMPGDTFHIDGSSDNLYAQWQKDKTGPDDSGVSNWLETDEHRAYLTGYPDSTFRADRNMTRAEVAQMFYALLLDKNVTITKSFSDVPDDAWYATAVKTLASLGMMDGYPDGTFRPDEPITRAEFATVGLAFAYDPLDASCSYYDVSASAWYHTYVAQATTYGWIGGYPDNTFRPGNNITRVEVCVIVNNMLGRDADERYIDRHEDELVHFVDLSDSYWGYYTIMESTNTHEYTGSFTNEKWTDVK